MRMARVPKRAIIPLVVTVVSLAAMGCSAKNDKAPESEALSPPAITLPGSEPDELAASRLPLDGYGVTEDQATVLFDAKEKALRDCMSTKGFDYVTEKRRTQQESAWLDPDNLGLVSAKHATTTGYHGPAVDRDAAHKRLTGQPPEYTAALSGAAPATAGAEPTDRGCQGTADQRLNPPGATSAKYALVDQLRAKAFDATLRDSRVTDAKKAWSQCMAKGGYQYADPAEPLAAAWPQTVSAQETETAVADMACKKESRLLGTWTAVITGYQKTLIDENAAALQGVQEDTAARIDRAKAVLGGAA